MQFDFITFGAVVIYSALVAQPRVRRFWISPVILIVCLIILFLVHLLAQGVGFTWNILSLLTKSSIAMLVLGFPLILSMLAIAFAKRKHCTSLITFILGVVAGTIPLIPVFLGISLSKVIGLILICRMTGDCV